MTITALKNRISELDGEREDILLRSTEGEKLDSDRIREIRSEVATLETELADKQAERDNATVVVSVGSTSEARYAAPGTVVDRNTDLDGLFGTPSAAEIAEARSKFNATLKGEREERAPQGVSVPAEGGHTAPIHTANEVFRLVSGRLVCAQAGARIVLYQEGSGQKWILPKLDSRPEATWRDEHAVITEDSATFSTETLTPKSLASLTKVSWELAQDSNVDMGSLVIAETATNMALTLDRAALAGSGVDPEPSGILTNGGIQTIDLAGAVLDHDAVASGFLAVQELDYSPTAMLVSHKRYAQLVNEKASGSGEWIGRSPLLGEAGKKGFQILASSQLDDDEILIGDFSNLVIGYRQNITAKVLDQLFAANGQIGYIVAARADVAIMRPDAFVQLTNPAAIV